MQHKSLATRVSQSRTQPTEGSSSMTRAGEQDIVQEILSYCYRIAAGTASSSAAIAMTLSVPIPTWATPASGGGNNGGRGGEGGGGGGREGGSSSEASGGKVSAGGRKRPVTITLVTFAVTRAAYQELTAKFSEKWAREQNQVIRFRLSVGGSGTQARAVIDGLPADVVALSMPFDVIKIQQAGLIDSDWQERVPNHGVNSESVCCIATQPGNPKRVGGWSDLPRKDVTVLAANPKTAGIARWTFFGLWGSVVAIGGSESEAEKYLEDVLQRIPVQPRDAREASDVFLNQKVTDVLLTYENEVININDIIQKTGRGEILQYVVPDVNVRIQNSVSVVDKVARANGTKEVSDAFVLYLFTPEAQRVFAKHGFRPVLPEILEEFKEKFPAVSNLWRVEAQLGEWDLVQERFFSANGLYDQLEDRVRSVRVSPSSGL
eukprot:TRINITY_DN4021_c0_g1_i2.p1 TRINITY_DN4021_c0_g1~~TRINITY_DN4021_c0_g1_i2.p1  ORF type:complete len:434 (-),score=100.43 TRINITY_DN4021_c0_g1_i2:209-1510(-)